MDKLVTFLRATKVGGPSCRGMVQSYFGQVPKGSRCWEGDGVAIIRADMVGTTKTKDILSRTTKLIRWGCTSPTCVPLANQVNPSHAINQVNNKRAFRGYLYDQDRAWLAPRTWFDYRSVPENAYPVVVRPEYHAQGKNFHLVQDRHQLHSVTQGLMSPYYISEFINKVAEYRVYVVGGRVVTVARKTPGDPKAAAWNVAQGGRFDVVKWSEWDCEACRISCTAMNLTDLDFGGVDVMVDADGGAYVIEINSAPSLPFLSDGSVSYRQSCMAAALMQVGEVEEEPVENYEHWKNFIHSSKKGN